jgi:hypothetical protein
MLIAQMQIYKLLCLYAITYCKNIKLLLGYYYKKSAGYLAK